MSELSSAAGGSAPKHHILSGGKRYPISLVTNAVKIAYEKTLFENARALLAGMKGMADKDWYERRLDALVEKFEQGEFAMGSKFGQQTMERPGGPLLLLGLLMGETNPTTGEITPFPELDLMVVIAQAPEEVAAVFKTVIKESFPNINIDKLTDQLSSQGETPGPKAQSTSPMSSSG